MIPRAFFCRRKIALLNTREYDGFGLERAAIGMWTSNFEIPPAIILGHFEQFVHQRTRDSDWP